ncbi:Protein of unknown function DUF3468 [Lasallia pustulata]|uniref:C6 transcription factor n=1 Tax=Lasallia pustulata TaxID=136370 RepID=A0A1W5CSJ1_9LECA|nr:Protein of unknown function DUF3468 [Lasallia pustulata]
MERKNFIPCTFWARDIPSFLNTAIEYDFVMSSVLALSATHLAWVTRSAETDNLAYHLRGLALNGLSQSIGNFCTDNSDAVLAASILLSWQASDWATWTSIMHGISTVVQNMRAWKDRSRFVEYIETHGALMSRSRMLPTALAFGGSGLLDDDNILPQAVSALQQILARYSYEHSISQRFKDLLRFTQDIQTGSATMQVDQLFEQLKPLREWLFWLPVATVQAREISIHDMVLLAHLYGVASAVDASIPELGGAPLGVLAARHIEELDRRIRFVQGSRRPGEDYALLNSSMQFPRAMASSPTFQKTIGSDLPSPGQQIPYGIQHLTIGSQPSTPGFPGQFPLGPPHSFEDTDGPASPFQHAFSAPTSRRQSQLLEAPPWSGGAGFDTRSPSTFIFREDSPAYSHRSFEDEQAFAVGGSASGYSGGCVAPSVWT